MLRQIWLRFAVLGLLAAPSVAYGQQSQSDLGADPADTRPADTRPAEPLVAERPGFTESSSTVPAMRLQLEAGIQYAHRDILEGLPPAGHTGRFDANTLSAPNMLLRFGVSDFAELRLGAPDIVYEQVTGASSDLSIGSLYLGAKVAGALSESIRSGAIPFVEVATEGGEVRAGLLATASIDLSSKVSVGINAGATSYDDELDRRQYQGHGTLSFGFSLSDRLGAFAEGYVVVPEGDADIFVDTGATYLVTPHLQLDAYMGTQIPEATQIFIGAGIAALF